MDRDYNMQESSQYTQTQRRRSRRSSRLVFDPDQDEGERRQIRKGLRDLTRDINDSRSEYMQAGNHGILTTIKKANEIFTKIKQTTDATIDSRLMVNAADLSYKKTTRLALGDVATGIDVDEFVSKCISFMRQGTQSPGAASNGTQGRAPCASGATQRYNGDSDDEEGGEPLDWDSLGRAACLQHNSRPSVSGFLLGPLSVEKRVRAPIQRRARERIDPSQAVRPQELREEDLDKQETTNLTSMCTQIHSLLAQAQRNGVKLAEAELEKYSAEDLDGDLVHEIMDKYNVADNGGVPLFRFCINPKSFGQSVENLFYISFLIRDGMVGISTDSRGFPTLITSKPFAPSEAVKKGVQKHQAVFSLDFEIWRQLIEVFGITKCVIPHRTEEVQGTRNGWYG